MNGQRSNSLYIGLSLTLLALGIIAFCGGVVITNVAMILAGLLIMSAVETTWRFWVR